MTPVLYTDTGIVDASYKVSTCIQPSYYDACDIIYYVIAVRARRMVRIFFLSYLGNRSKSDPCSYELFCLESHILSFPKVLHSPPESPCIRSSLKRDIIRVVPRGVTFKTCTFMCLVYISEQTAIISLYCINWLVFITRWTVFTARYGLNIWIYLRLVLDYKGIYSWTAHHTHTS